MFSLIISLFLLVGQNPNYTYLSEHATFKEAPSFILSINSPSETPKTKVELLKRDDIREKRRPLRLNPREVVPYSSPINPRVESGQIFSKVQSKPLPPIKIEKVKKKTSETVYFDFDSYELKPSERAKLDSLSRDIDYRVTGYTCDIGTKEYNDRLALKRAEAVKNYLGNIVKEINGKGKCCYIDQVDKSKNRRAEIKPLNIKNN